MGLLLNPDGSGLRFENLELNNPVGDWLNYDEVEVENRFSQHNGVWSVEGDTLRVTYCYRVGAPFSPFPDCDTSGNRWLVENAHVEREFELVSAVDLDNDGIIDRVYGIERLEFRLGALWIVSPSACDVLNIPVESGLCTDDGRARWSYQSNLQSYDLGIAMTSMTRMVTLLATRLTRHRLIPTCQSIQMATESGMRRISSQMILGGLRYRW